MENEPKQGKERVDSEILFSKTVKAGKRIYYIDVKKDRKGELYLSLTESKRLKEQGDAAHPVFEKHKIFLYREDLNKFLSAFSEAANYAQSNAPQQSYANDWSGPLQEDNSVVEVEGTEGNYKIDIEF